MARYGLAVSPRSALRLAAGLALLAGLACGGGGGASAPADVLSVADAQAVALIRSRLSSYYQGQAGSGSGGWLASQQADGSWRDVAYADQSSVNWLALDHLDRLQAMAAAYATPGGPDHRSAAMLSGVLQGLRYWYALRPANPNWWFNDIGQQKYLEAILILVADVLPQDVLAGGRALLLDSTQVPPGYATGQNLLDIEGEQMVRGVLGPSLADLSGAMASIGAAIVITSGDGIQADRSFHQHGAMLQSGSYGLDFIQAGSFWAAMTAATPFALGKDRVGLLSAYLLQGSRAMVRGAMFDYGAQGRALTRKGASAQADGLLEACAWLAQVDPADSAQYAALADHIKGTGQSYAWLGNRQFWNSDFMAHGREGYHASVKMFSARTLGTEELNGENAQGYWLPFGTTLLCQRGDEYRDIFPVWDWSRLPGVTAPHALGIYAAPFDQAASFVGGVSDGTYGAAVMAVDKDGFQARKAWFFFDDEWVALGTGITATWAAPVATTLNQCLLNGPVLVDGVAAQGPGPQSYPGVSWVLHDGVGYVLPAPATLVLANGPRTGTWQAINAQYDSTPVTADVFLLYQDHGIAPAAAGYGYIVLPGATAAGIAAYAAAPPVAILANGPTLQAVSHSGLGLTEAAFHQAGSLAIPGGPTLAVDQPCIVLLEEQANPPTAVVANPEGGALTVHLTVTPATAAGRSLVFDLPGGQLGGASLALPLP